MGDRHNFLNLDSRFRFKKTVYFYDKEAPISPGNPPGVSPSPTPTISPSPSITPTPSVTPTPTPTPSPINYYLLTENDNTLVTEGSDNLVWFPV